MREIGLELKDFPALVGRKSVTWAPVFLSPIVGSPERLVIAVAVADDRDGIVCSASGLERLRCLYGESSDLIIAAAKGAISELQMKLSEEGKDFLKKEEFSTGLVYTGTPMQSTAKEMGGLAKVWLETISSLHDMKSEFFLHPPEEERVKVLRLRGDRLSSEVLQLATERKSPILKFFTKSVVRSNSRVPLTNVSVDYHGKRVVANFSTLRPTSNLRSEFDRILRRLWALDLNQTRAGHSDSDAVQYELILQRPKLSDFSGEGERISRALDELAGQADEKKLGFRQFSNVVEMVDHLEKREAA